MGEENRFWPGPWANNDLEQGAMQIFLFVSPCHDLQDFCVHGIACIAHTVLVTSKRNPHEWSNLDHGSSGLWQPGKKGILCTFVHSIECEISSSYAVSVRTTWITSFHWNTSRRTKTGFLLPVIFHLENKAVLLASAGNCQDIIRLFVMTWTRTYFRILAQIQLF